MGFHCSVLMVCIDLLGWIGVVFQRRELSGSFPSPKDPFACRIFWHGERSFAPEIFCCTEGLVVLELFPLCFIIPLIILCPKKAALGFKYRAFEIIIIF